MKDMKVYGFPCLYTSCGKTSHEEKCRIKLHTKDASPRGFKYQLFVATRDTGSHTASEHNGDLSTVRMSRRLERGPDELPSNFWPENELDRYPNTPLPINTLRQTDGRASYECQLTPIEIYR